MLPAHALVISVNARDRFVEELKRLVILVFTNNDVDSLVPLAVYDEDSHYLLQFVRVVLRLRARYCIAFGRPRECE